MAETPDFGNSARTNQESIVPKEPIVDALATRRFINKHRSFVYGMMLGDGSIDSRGSSAFFSVKHAEDQKDLIFYKWKIMEEVAPVPPVRSEKVQPNCQPTWKFRSARNSEWQRIWSVFHENCRTAIVNGVKWTYKVVNERILNEVQDDGLAVWIMDDGTCNYRKWPDRPLPCPAELELCTSSFSTAENELIVAWLKKKYDVQATISTRMQKLMNGERRPYHTVRMGLASILKILPRVYPYILPSFRYKIGLPQDKGRLSILESMKHSELTRERESCLETISRQRQVAGQ